MVASHTFEELRHELAQDEESFAARVRASNLHGTTSTPIENTIQGSKSIDAYFKEMKNALRRAGMDDPISMKFHFMMGLHNDISKTIFLENYKSLDDNYIGALKAEQELMKAKASPSQANFAATKLHENEHEDSTTKMSKPDELQDDAPKFDFTAIPLCGIDGAESTTTLLKMVWR